MKILSTDLVRELKNQSRLGIRGRLVSAFVGVASLTLIASIVAFFSYNYIRGNLHHIETEGIPVMNRALIFARQAAEYSTIASALRVADDKAGLSTIVGQLRAKHKEMTATLDALRGNGIETIALTDLKDSANKLAKSTDSLATAMERRLSASGQRKRVVESALATHRRIVEKLAPLLDDASFDLTIGLESLHRTRVRDHTVGAKHAQINASVLQGLSDVRAESHIALGILMEVSLSPSTSLLTPLRDRFTATSDRARKAVASVEKVKKAGELRSAFESLLALGSNPSDLFGARRAELEAISATWQLVAESQQTAAMLATQVQSSVKTAEDATSTAVTAARAAITQSQSLLIFLAVLSLGSAIVFAWIYVGRGLLVRLGKLNEAILALAGGDLEVEIPHDGRDELTRIAAAVEVFKRNAIEARELEADKERGRIADLKQREASFRLLFEDNPVPMWVFDRKSLRFLSVNNAAVRHYGYTREQFQSMTVLDVRPHQSREEVIQFLRESDGNHQGEEVWQHLKADGTVFEVVAYSRALPYQNTEAALVAIIDITERKKAEARIAHMAHHDALTNLANRVLFRERLDEALTRDWRNKKGIAVLALDLDRFKEVNDTLGHPIGDALLNAVADRLRSCVRETDTVARLGGDEFAILQVATAQPADATALAERICTIVSAPYLLDGNEVVVGTSVGIAVSPAGGSNADQLLKNADLALYRVKTEGRGAFRFFEPEMDASMQARRSLELDLRQALANGEFELYYQPVVDIERNEISGLEALIRWRHPTRGMVPPSVFIPVAEEIGLIVPIGEWVLRTACAAAANWPEHIRVSVNLSPVQFRTPGLVKVILGALARSGLAPGRLELEITETTLLENSESTLELLYQMRELGVGIAMDDFGTGYSSLSYLQSFPFQRIKIDRSFVKDIAEHESSLNIVRAVAALASGLQMTTTAEGVETKEQLEKLRLEGCNEMQGFLFSKPIPAGEVDEYLATQAGGANTAARGSTATAA